MNTDFTCISSRINLDIPHQIWEAVSSDQNTGVLLTRLFHNKLSFYGSNYLQCYLSYLSPDFITATFTIIGLILFLIGLYCLISRKHWWLLFGLLLAPLFPLFEFPALVIIRVVLVLGAELLVMGYGIFYLIFSRKFKHV